MRDDADDDRRPLAPVRRADDYDRGRAAHVIAVEPDPAMRAVHGDALEGAAEAIPLADASVDTACVAEAWHRCAASRRSRACCGRAGGWCCCGTSRSTRSRSARCAREHVHAVDADGYLAMVASWSWVAALPDAERAPKLEALRAEVAGGIAIRFRAEAWWTQVA